MAKNILQQTTPAAIWQRIAGSKRKYLLIGDGDHMDVGVKEAVVAALPVLSAGAFRHLGLEQDRQREQGAVDAFQFASAAQRRSERDVDTLLTYMTSMGQKCLIPDDEKLLADQIAGCRMLMIARDRNIRVHCLNNMLGLTEFFQSIGVPDAEKLGRFGEYAFRHRKAPSRISYANLLRLDALMGLYQDDYNFSLDAQRAKDLKRVSGKSRAALIFGARHFGRKDGTSIEAYLPPASSVFVYIGAARRVAERIAESKKQGRLKLPDFAIETDTGRGLVLAPARSNGLI